MIHLARGSKRRPLKSKSFQAAYNNGLILGHLGKEDARYVFGLGFRFALGYLFKAHREDDQ